MYIINLVVRDEIEFNGNFDMNQLYEFMETNAGVKREDITINVIEGEC